jgi:uncharacterized protein (TIGR03083 family)
MIDKATHCDAFHREAAAVAAAARLGLEAPVPSCPGWSVAALVTHLAADVYAGRIRAFQALPNEVTIASFADLGLPSRFEAWVESDRSDLTLVPDGLIELYEATAATLEAELRALHPDQHIKTWWSPQQNAGFLQRRLALETAIHRWDAQLAHGVPEAIEPALAADGIDESLDVMLFAHRKRADNLRESAGETFHFHRTDGPGEWLVKFPPDGPIVSREHAKGDVAVRGTASDLFLFLWHRIPADRLEVFGDVALAQRYFELVPPS